MGVGRRSPKGRRRKTGPGSLASRIDTITAPRPRVEPIPTLGSGVIAPGTSRYQRMSAHLPSGVTRFQGMGVLPADVAVDLTSEEPSLDLTV